MIVCMVFVNLIIVDIIVYVAVNCAKFFIIRSILCKMKAI